MGTGEKRLRRPFEEWPSFGMGLIKPTCRCRPPGARLLGTWTLRFWPRHDPMRSLSCSRKLDMPSFPDRLHVQMGRARGGKSSDEELDVEYQRKGPRGCSTVHRVGMDDFTELKSSAWRPRIVRRTHGTAAWFTAGSSLLAVRKTALT